MSDEGKAQSKAGILVWLKRAVAIFIVLMVCFYVFRPANVNLWALTIISTFAGIIVAMTFLSYPARKGAPSLTWYNFCLAALIMVVSIYLAINAKTVSQLERAVNPLEMVFAAIAIMLVAEGVRRTLGILITIVFLFFVLFPLVAMYAPFISMPRIMWPTVTGVVYLGVNGMYGLVLDTIVITVTPYFLLGQLFVGSGATKYILDTASALVGRYSGGPAKIAVVASAGYGTLTGGAIGNIAVTGSFTIPLMKRMGFSPEYAGAVEAAASNGGTIMPPVMGLVSFLIAQFLGVPYGYVVLAAVIPAIIYYVGVFCQVHFQSRKAGLRGLPPEMIPSFWKAALGGWHVWATIIILVIFLVPLGWPAGLSGWYTDAIFIALSAVRKETRFGLKAIWSSADTFIQLLFYIIPVVMSTGGIMGSFTATGLGIAIVQMIRALAGGNMFILLVLAAALAFIMGMGLPGILTYVLLAILIAPPLTQAGIPPLAAHFFFFWWATTSAVTPPIAAAIFVAAPMAGAKFWPTAWKATALSLAMFIIPFVFVYKPALLTLGTPLEIVIATATAIACVVLLSSFAEGYFMKRLNWIERVLALAAGILIVFPQLSLVLTGVVLTAVFVLWQWWERHILTK